MAARRSVSAVDRSLDPQRLAALLDGRLGVSERGDLLARIGTSEDDVALLADAAAIVASDPTSGQSGAAAGSPVSRGRSLQVRGTWLAAAAAVLVVVGLGIVQHRFGGSGSVADDYGAILDPHDIHWGALPAAWVPMRGAESAASARGTAARLGARLTDLEWSIRARNTDLAPAARSVAALIESTPAPRAIVAAFRDIARDSALATPELLDRFDHARTAALRVADPKAAGAGGWLEAARIAAASHDAGFFQAPASQDGARRLRAIKDLTVAPADAALLEKLATGGSLGPSDWDAVDAMATKLLTSLAR